jgi:hypothetical protein
VLLALGGLGMLVLSRRRDRAEVAS